MYAWMNRDICMRGRIYKNGWRITGDTNGTSTSSELQILQNILKLSVGSSSSKDCCEISYNNINVRRNSCCIIGVNIWWRYIIPPSFSTYLYFTPYYRRGTPTKCDIILYCCWIQITKLWK